MGGGSHAFWEADGITRERQQIQLEIQEDSIFAEITETLHNKGSQSQEFFYWRPLPRGTEQAHWYLELEGKPFEILSGQDRVEAIIEQVATQEAPRFFRLASHPFEQLFRSSKIRIDPGQSLDIKLTYRFPADFAEDVFFTQWFVWDDIPAQDFRFIVRGGSNAGWEHFFTTLPTESSQQDRSEEGIVTYLFEASDFAPTQNIDLFWSERNTPLFRFSTKEGLFEAQFADQVVPQKKQEIQILVDQSGSMASVWSRVQDWVRFVLEHLPADAQVNGAVFTEESQYWSDDFTQTGFEEQRDILSFLEKHKPVGKTDILQALSTANTRWTVPPSERVLILFTDYEQAPSPDWFESPTIWFDLSEKEAPSELLKNVVQETGGFVVPLFRVGLGLIEADDFLRNWNHWYREASLEEKEEWIPERFGTFFGFEYPLFVRKEESNTALGQVQAFRFVARLWAGRHIADLLEQLEGQTPFPTEILDAMLSVGRRFGIETSLFNASTQRSELQKRLRETAFSQIQRFQEVLREPFQYTHSFQGILDGLTPFYSEDQVWRRYDFFARVHPETVVSVQPFSEGLYDLFRLNPKQFAIPLSLGTSVQGCWGFRCFQIQPEGRASLRPSEKHFWIVSPPVDHWAYGFARTLFDSVGFPLQEGHLALDTPMTRGLFLQLLGSSLYGEAFTWEGDLNEFQDITSKTPFAQAIGFFVEKGVIQGYEQEDGTKVFRPDQALTRAEAVKILLAAEGFVPKTSDREGPPRFPDALGWERPWVEEAARRGIVQGYVKDSEAIFAPHRVLSRGEAAKLIVKAPRP